MYPYKNFKRLNIIIGIHDSLYLHVGFKHYRSGSTSPIHKVISNALATTLYLAFRKLYVEEGLTVNNFIM